MLLFCLLYMKGVEIMNNIDIRIEMLKGNLTITKLAKQLKITRPSLSRKLRYTLSNKEKTRVLQAIEELKNS